MKDLRQLAEAATPGPWSVDKDFPKKVVANDYYIAQVHNYAEDNRDDTGAVNAAYIAAANPTAILAMLDTIDAQRKLLERTRSLLQYSDYDNIEKVNEANNLFDDITAHLGATK